MNYKEKLIQFNSTEKYKKETEFLLSIMKAEKHHNVLDYGCGLGTIVRLLRSKDIRAYGYDVNNYRLEDDEHLFRTSYHFSFDKIYFMHAIAHIPDVFNILDRLFWWATKKGTRIYVITPDKSFLDQINNPDYIPDPTVKGHFYEETLRELFINLGFDIIKSGNYGIERLYLIAEKK